ncbi:MAG: hypothetical protein ACOVRN_01820 [Flavobacterium sp.]
MTIELFGYKLEVELLIFIAVLYLIMLIHILFSVIKVDGVGELAKEGYQSLKESLRM